MEPSWKQFVAWAIALKPNVFVWTRLKLTAIYVLILAVILVGFSFTLYRSLGTNLLDASEEDFVGQESHQHFVHSTLETVRDEILVIDIAILLVAAGIGYVLAGYTLRPIQKSLDAQKKFSENASHELRTPLAVIKNDIEVLLRDPHPTKQSIERTLTSSIEEIDHMTELTEDLLTIARSENHRTDFVRVNLVQIAQDIVKKMEPIATRKGVNVVLVAHAPLYVRGHAGSQARILMNLLQNSIEHTPPDGTVTVKLTAEEEQRIVVVSDAGTGIAEKDLPHVFERFYRGGHTTGSGLGLAIVKELVTQHRGTVHISSKKDQGTTVTIRYPSV